MGWITEFPVNIKGKPAITTITGILVFLGLHSCSVVRPKPTFQGLIPTEQLPTVIAMTVEAMMSQEGTATTQSLQETLLGSSTPTQVDLPSQTPTSSPPFTSTQTATLTPAVTSTPLPPYEIPYSDIQFLNPGALSKVISPIRLHAFLLPGDLGRATVELYGEDGRLMYRQLFVFSSPAGVQTNLRTDIDFEIEGVAETARLLISVDDSYGRVKEIASIPLILLDIGDSDLNPAGDLLAPIVIQEPTAKVLIQGGKLLVSGLVRTDSDQPLLVELISTEGKVIGSRLAGISPGNAGDHRLFATVVTFSVEAPTWVRVTISERTNGSPKPAQLTSIEVLLSP